MPDLTEEEYDALDEYWTKNTPKLGPNGTGFFSQRKTASGPNSYNHLAGALKLSDKQYENYQKTLQEGRNEWDRNNF